VLAEQFGVVALHCGLVFLQAFPQHLKLLAHREFSVCDVDVAVGGGLELLLDFEDLVQRADNAVKLLS
jgi:hypothetical protein